MQTSEDFLNETLHLVHEELGEALLIKDFFPKVLKRFNEHSFIVFRKFPLYRLACNLFENTILEKKSPESFCLEVKKKLIPLEEEGNQLIIQYTNDLIGVEMYRGIRDYFNKHLLECLVDMVKKSSDPNESQLILISKGKKFLLSSFLSAITVLYGLRGISRSTFIFYYQSFYESFKDIGQIIRDLCLKNLNKEFSMVLSFRFVDEEFKDKLNLSQLDESLGDIEKHFKKYSVSCLSNAVSSNPHTDLFSGATRDDNVDLE